MLRIHKNGPGYHFSYLHRGNLYTSKQLTKQKTLDHHNRIINGGSIGEHKLNSLRAVMGEIYVSFEHGREPLALLKDFGNIMTELYVEDDNADMEIIEKSPYLETIIGIFECFMGKTLYDYVDEHRDEVLRTLAPAQPPPAPERPLTAGAPARKQPPPPEPTPPPPPGRITMEEYKQLTQDEREKHKLAVIERAVKHNPGIVIGSIGELHHIIPVNSLAYLIIDFSNLYYGFQTLAENITKKQLSIINLIDFIHSFNYRFDLKLVFGNSTAITKPIESRFQRSGFIVETEDLIRGREKDTDLHIAERLINLQETEPSTLLFFSGDGNNHDRFTFPNLLLELLNRGWCVIVFAYSTTISKYYVSRSMVDEHAGLYHIFLMDKYFSQLSNK